LLAASSPALAEKKRNLERFLFDKVYRHPTVVSKREIAQRALHEVFEVLNTKPEELPAKFRRLAERDGVPRSAADYIAGMTDRFALEEHRRLLGRS
jgi:dGTPase